MDNEKLTPVTDDELANIINEISSDFEKNLNEEVEQELDPRMEEVLNAPTIEERIKLYNKYFGEFVLDEQ